MPVSPRYAFSDLLKLWFFVVVSVLYIFMSVNIAERPTFEKRVVHFDRGVFANVICLVL